MPNAKEKNFQALGEKASVCEFFLNMKRVKKMCVIWEEILVILWAVTEFRKG